MTPVRGVAFLPDQRSVIFLAEMGDLPRVRVPIGPKPGGAVHASQ